MKKNSPCKSRELKLPSHSDEPTSASQFMAPSLADVNDPKGLE